MDCIFCKIINGDISTKFLYQDEDLVALSDINPKAKTHVLVVPRKHIKSLAELDLNDSKLISKIILTLPKIANSLGLTSGFRTIINTGAGGGQEIDHLHVHILGGKNLPGF